MLRKQNPHIRRGLYAFVIMSASYKLLALFMYGLFLRVKEVYPVQEDLTVAVCLALLVLVGKQKLIQGSGSCKHTFRRPAYRA